MKVPDTFQSDNHYKYVWITNFFYELQHSLLRDKAESIEVENYIEMDVCVNFLYATELEDKISLFRLNTNKKLCDLKKKVLKENDIVAFYPNTINISSNDISFKNEKDKYYFIGIISINDSNETLCKVHYKSADKFSLKNQKGNTIYYTTRYRLIADNGKTLTKDNKKFVSAVTIPEDELSEWKEVPVGQK